MKNFKISSLCLILLLSVIFIFGLVGCGAETAKNETSDMIYAPSSPSIKESYSSNSGFMADMEASKDMAYDVPMNPVAPVPPMEPSVDTAGKGEIVADAATAIDMAEKIIYSANMNIESAEFDAALQAVEKLLADFGGFIANSNITGSSSYDKDGNLYLVNRYAYYTLRIPALRFEEFLNSAGNLGNITSKSQNADNITAQFYDNEARKLSLETQEQRLLELLAEAKDINDIIILEGRLSEVRYEIESIESRLKNWQGQVDYSTVNITIREVAKYTPHTPVQLSFGERFVAAIGGSLENFSDDFQDFVIDLIYSLPALLIWAAIIIVAVILIRKGLRRRNPVSKGKTKSAEPAETENENNE